MAESKKPAAASRPAKGKKPAATSKSAATGRSAAAKGAKKPAAKKAAPKPNLEERMEGVQGWMAEIEKKQERTSRFGGVAVGLAILAAGGALALGIMNKQDGATQGDLDELTEQVNALGASVKKQTEGQLRSLNQRLATIEQQVASLNQRQRQTESEITSLQNSQQAAAAAAAAPTADSGGAKDKP